MWQDGGPPVDLNTLIPPGSGIHVSHAVSINDRGEISGDGYLPNGDHHAFVMIPCDENHLGVEGCDYTTIDAGEITASVSTAGTIAPTSVNSQPLLEKDPFRCRSASRSPAFRVQPPE